MIFKHYTLLALALALCGVGRLYAQPLQVVSYNVENLFHPTRDSLKDDAEWTPEGERHWTYKRYDNKVENIARVLTRIGEWSGVDIVGLQEVENALCVKRLCNTLRANEYDFVHYDSPDRRGIDVALIYKKERIDTLCTRAIRIQHPALVTRDILYVCARVDRRDTLHFFVCHLPSQLGGSAETQWKREYAKQVLQDAVDSVWATNPDAKIVVMGDMNSTPQNDLAPLINRMSSISSGTHKYQGRWTCLDQFYVSPALDSIADVRIYDAQWIQETDEKYLGLKPYRTFNGFQYRNGFSDHLPIILQLF